jgi:aryl-alcohol dehydrogenase-like predicted oxidoreductase
LKEAEVNRGWKRHQFFLMASVGGYGYWWDKFPNGTDAAAGTRIQIEETLKHLDVDYLDHMFLHMPPQSMLAYQSCAVAEQNGTSTCEEMMSQWKVMEEYVRNGKSNPLGFQISAQIASLALTMLSLQ